MHRLWAGTKLVALGLLSLTASIKPTWPTLLAWPASCSSASWPVASHRERSLACRVGFFSLSPWGRVVSLRSNAPPLVHMGSVALSLGGLGSSGAPPFS